MNLDTLVRTAGDVADASPDTLTSARLRLDQAVAGAGLRVAAARRGRRRRRAAGLLAAAAAVVGAVVAVPVLTAGPASAESVLLAAADASGSQPDIAAAAPYWHVVSEVGYPDAAPAQREVWHARTGVGVLRDGTDTAPGAPLRTDSLATPDVFVVGGHGLSWADLDALPTDPVELGRTLRALVAGHPSGEDNELWESVTGLLLESPASPELRRALWQVAATVPGVELLGATTDAAGRQGTGIERDELADGWYRVVYVLDPSDGTVLETRNVDADGDVAFRWTLVEQGPADSAPPVDPPLCGPGSEPFRSC